MIEKALRNLLDNPAIDLICNVARRTFDDPPLQDLDPDKQAVAITAIEAMLVNYFMAFIDSNLEIELLEWIDQTSRANHDLIPLINFGKYV